MMTHEEWMALVEDSHREAWGFFRRQGGVKVGKRWRFPRAWLWWDRDLEHYRMKGRNGWKFRWYSRLVDIVETDWPDEAANAIRMMRDNMVKVGAK